MNDFERGFAEELEKVAKALKVDLGAQPEYGFKNIEPDWWEGPKTKSDIQSLKKSLIASRQTVQSRLKKPWWGRSWGDKKLLSNIDHDIGIANKALRELK